MMSDTANSGAQPPPSINIQNTVTANANKAWSILTTLLVVGGITVIGYQLSLGPYAEVTATGISMFLVALVINSFKAGILRVPESSGEDNFEFTKSAARKIYDEVQAAIVNSGMARIVLFSAGYALAFVILRSVVAAGLAAISSMWMAIGLGLLLGAAVIAQDQIWAWLRRSWTRKGVA
jgi:hypothetical protein